MASPPSTLEDVAESVKKPLDAEADYSTQNVQYDEPAHPRKLKGESRQKSRRKIWKKFRQGQESDWWFASTGIPLLAATISPLANVLSIAALVTSWRQQIYLDSAFVAEFDGKPFADPRWCYWINVASLICGFLGNVFLLLNFTQRIRYLVALPASIILWYLSTGFLIGITACMQIYAPPDRPYQTYTQGFWYGIAAAALYLICSMILMVNMLGYFLGHYPDTFELTDAQRTLILQTMLFFIWLAGGAALFQRIETDAGEIGWDFVDALYFCDVTILTVGFGDLYPTTDLGRGIVFPYSVGGIIMLGLVISSLYKFVRQLGEENIIQGHVKRMRERTIDRAVTNSFDLRQREHDAHRLIRRSKTKDALHISGPSNARAFRTAMGNTVRRAADRTPGVALPKALQKRRKPRLLLLREEKDRFDAMRKIQQQTRKLKQWYALTFSILAFAILWCVGAAVFWRAESSTQDMTYFRALYFCYISLLTIGYGDMSPKSNAGRCFFVVWSLIAVPTMTILISDLGDTVIAKFKQWSSDLADFTVLPKNGVWRVLFDRYPWLLGWLQQRLAERAARRRVERGFETADPEADGEAEPDISLPTAQPLATSTSTSADMEPSSLAPLTRTNLVLHLVLGIRKVSADLRLPHPKRYTYEEWLEFTRLIRFSKYAGPIAVLADWDWIGEDSPLVSGLAESEWLLGRLIDTLLRQGNYISI
ncbi:hypothetical protein BDV95DRAFT_629330 [Massariosphaeria phaeospora]|uniref:Potassium channel domain-containing protein n=1 Tax=Massariosphaeria phaeospora TaxID=100035 RepID=A0A7C8I8K1_9PLEO|nr:hypothetical protein BDV95DRAFT_629330 [Massariosphaeria phaeospora]